MILRITVDGKTAQTPSCRTQILRHLITEDKPGFILFVDADINAKN
jgi:hypothetical protein